MTPKSATKNAAKQAKQAKPAPVTALLPFDAAPIHKLVAADLRAMLATGKAAGAEYATFRAVLLAVPLNDTKALEAVAKDIKATFGEEHADAAQIRINILNNARKVAHGGVKDKVAYQGRGRQAMLDALDSVASIRELKKAMAEAKPEGLKDARGGKREGSGKVGKPTAVKAVQAPTLGKATKRADAFQACLNLLAFIEAQFLKPGTDAETIGQIEATITALRKVA